MADVLTANLGRYFSQVNLLIIYGAMQLAEHEDPLDLLDDDDNGVIEMCLLDEEEKQKKGSSNKNSGCCVAFFLIGISLLTSWCVL